MDGYAVAIFDLDESACAKTVAAVEEEQGGKAADQTTPSSATSSSNTPQTDFRVLQHGRGLLREAGKEPPSGAVRVFGGQCEDPASVDHLEHSVVVGVDLEKREPMIDVSVADEEVEPDPGAA
jgi:hypothetical protein